MLLKLLLTYLFAIALATTLLLLSDSFLILIPSREGRAHYSKHSQS